MHPKTTTISDESFHKSRAWQEAWNLFHSLNGCEWNPSEGEKDGIRANALSLLHHINAGGIPEHVLRPLSKTVQELTRGIVTANTRFAINWIKSRLA